VTETPADPGREPDDGSAGPGVRSPGLEGEEVRDTADAARAALARARDAARERGLVPGSPGRRPTGTRRSRGGHHPDVVPGAGRDPELLGSTMGRLSAQLGWRQSLSVGGVVGRWREIVGDTVADHCVPETFEGGALVVRADSTAWATQIRLLLPQLQRRLEEEVGDEAVTSIQVLGPGGPTWRRGPRSVPGRGPRDTYG
jgi:predicted nucleic acid-binding Zn ribbon protein